MLYCIVKLILKIDKMPQTIIIQHASNFITISKYRKMAILTNVRTVQANYRTVGKCHKGGFFSWACSSNDRFQTPVFKEPYDMSMVFGALP